MEGFDNTEKIYFKRVGHFLSATCLVQAKKY